MPFLSALSAISEMLSRCTIPSLSCHVMPFHDTISLMPSLSTAYIACDPVIHRLSSSAVLLTKCLSSASHVSRLRLTSLVFHVSCLISHVSSTSSVSHLSSRSSVSHLSLLCLMSHIACRLSLVCATPHLSCLSHVSSLQSQVSRACLMSLACRIWSQPSTLSPVFPLSCMSHVSHLTSHDSHLTSHISHVCVQTYSINHESPICVKRERHDTPITSITQKCVPHYLILTTFLTTFLSSLLFFGRPPSTHAHLPSTALSGPHFW